MHASYDPAGEVTAATPVEAPITSDGSSLESSQPATLLEPSRRRPFWMIVAGCAAVGLSLAALSRVDYVAFHLIAEVAVLVVLGTIFAIAWHTQRLSSNGYLVIVGMAALPIALVIALHALTYRGMPVFLGRTTDTPTQLWLVARYLTAVAFLVAPAFAARRVARPVAALGLFAAAAAVLVASVFAGLFPVAFVEGQGLTAFKVISEYVVIGAFALAFVLLWRTRGALPRDVFGLLAGCIGASIAAELLFTTYVDVYGITNMLGHLAYLLSFYLLYLALVDVTLERPYETLFRELSQREAALREAHRFAEGVNDIDSAINSTLDSEEILQRVVDMAGSIIGADAVVLGLFEGDHFRPRYFRGYSGDEFGSLTLDRDIGRHIFKAWELGRPIAIADAAEDPNVSPELVRATGVRAILANVLAVRDQPVGGLGFHWLHAPHVATPEEIDFARKVTASLALALDNARSYAREHEIAEALQTDMTSAAERMTGVDVGLVYIPAPGPGRIGGDFFDAFALDANRLAFLIGDVVGRGLAAAATNAMTRSIVRALAYVEPEPSVVLARAGHTLGHQLEETEFVTAAFGVLDTQTGEVRLGIAGHPDPIVAERMDLEPPEGSRCAPLGVPSHGVCDPWTFALQPGETLLLYTDGVLETRQGEDFFGSDRLRAAIGRAAGSPSAQQVADVVLTAVRDFAGGDVSDDLAILAIRFLGVESS